MSANRYDYEFDEFDKPGAERARRRRGEDDNLDGDLEEDLLEEDWPSGKKNASEVSDEELNDDLLQSDEEEIDMSGQDVSLNASYSLGTSYDQQDNLQGAEYTDDVVNQGAQGFEEGQAGEEGYQHEGEEDYAEEYGQESNAEMSKKQMDYGGDGYQDEVLDIHINEPLDGEFQDDEYQTYDDQPLDELGVQQEAPEEEVEEEEEVVGGDEQQEDDNDTTAQEPQNFDGEMFESETLPEVETKEESDDEDEEDEESGRVRFRSERKEGVVVRLADASKRRNIPETLELSEKAKQDLMEFEEQERQRRQNRHGGRGRGGGRGGRVRGGCPSFGLMDFRRGNRGRISDQRPPLMGAMGKLPSRMLAPHQLHQQHHPLHPRGPPSFQEHGRPLVQQPLQPLIPPHMTHRSPPLRPQIEPPPRILSSPPPNFPQHHQEHPLQPKNIHINPHFRGHPTSSVRVPLMPPAQSQPRHAVSPQRFPGPGDFQQHMPGNFGLLQRSTHHIEPFRNQPPQGPPDREPLFMGDRTESTRFPGQHMFDHQSSSPLNNNQNLHHQQQLPNQGHMGFGPPGPHFNQLGQGPVGLFPREPLRPNLPPNQGHQGMINLNQGGSPNQPRPFMGPRQHFGQQGNPFPPPQVQFGMQVQHRGLMHGPPGPQIPHRDPLPPHQPMHQHQHHHRQEPLHREQQQQNISELRPMMLQGQNLFPQQQQQLHGRPMNSRPQNLQQRTMANRQRMSTPQHISKPMQPRNSNLRELPIAPGDTNMNSSRPAANVRPVAKATQGVRPEQSTQAVPAGGRGRGQNFAKTDLHPGGEGSAVFHKEEAQRPDEDEETRQYRLKIEEQKRLREEILKRKEMRRQMQAGVRKKELLDRLNSQTPGQIPALSQTTTPQPAPHQQPLQPQQQQEQLQQPQQQRQFTPRSSQPLSQPLIGSSALVPLNGGAQTPALGPHVKTRLQMTKGLAQQQQAPRPDPSQQWKQPHPNQQPPLQQRRNAPMPNKLGAEMQVNEPHQRNIPLISTVASAPIGPKPGVKRTVMQRTNISLTDGQQLPPKVRVIKLCGAGVKGPAASDGSEQQQGTRSAAPMNQSIQRKVVTVTGQQQQAAGRGLQANRGAMGHTQQNRVVVSAQSRGRGRGSGQMGRGRLPSTRQIQRVPGSECRTVTIEGLSSSTTDMQLKNLLRSIGPIEMFSMFPQQRKAVAKFTNPEHAANFQMSFHRHMIDLSHIDVSLTDG